MDIEDRLRALESRYRKALSASIGAKAHYLALLDEPNSTPASIKRARVQWGPSMHVDGNSQAGWAK
jgi:hypothetical protein